MLTHCSRPIFPFDGSNSSTAKTAGVKILIQLLTSNWVYYQIFNAKSRILAQSLALLQKGSSQANAINCRMLVFASKIKTHLCQIFSAEIRILAKVYEPLSPKQRSDHSNAHVAKSIWLVIQFSLCKIRTDDAWIFDTKIRTFPQGWKSD